MLTTPRQAASAQQLNDQGRLDLVLSLCRLDRDAGLLRVQMRGRSTKQARESAERAYYRTAKKIRLLGERLIELHADLHGTLEDE